VQLGASSLQVVKSMQQCWIGVKENNGQRRK
jgi:hypothetical protein